MIRRFVTPYADFRLVRVKVEVVYRASDAYSYGRVPLLRTSHRGYYPYFSCRV